MSSDLSTKELMKRKFSDINLDVDYISNFIPKETADELFRSFEKEFSYFTGQLSKVKVFGKWHDIPRKQVAYGDDGIEYKYSGNVFPALPWPKCLGMLRNILKDVSGHDYNFVLVNRYNDGNDYMGEHKDDERELDPNVPIASLSFGQSRDFIFKCPKSLISQVRCKNHTIPLNHGDLLFMNHPTNRFWNHCIPRRKNLPGVRISLTFRKVIKVDSGKRKACDLTSSYFKKAKLL